MFSRLMSINNHLYWLITTYTGPPLSYSLVCIEVGNHFFGNLGAQLLGFYIIRTNIDQQRLLLQFGGSRGYSNF